MLRKAAVSVCALAMFAGVTVTTAYAQHTSDRRTYFTFSGPVELPGKTLPAGKYTFRIPGADTAHRIVEVASADGMKTLGLFHTVPAERLNPVEKPEMRFMETPAGSPRAAQTWWFAGEIDGREFIYPKEQARRLAKATHQPVLTTQSETTTASQTNTDSLSRIDASGEETKVADTAKPAPAAPTGIAQSGEPVGTIARANSDERPAATGTAGRRRLPRTASSLPMFELLAGFALAGGFGIGVWRRRFAGV